MTGFRTEGYDDTFCFILDDKQVAGKTCPSTLSGPHNASKSKEMVFFKGQNNICTSQTGLATGPVVTESKGLPATERGRRVSS
jgi:hypothetical protein